MATVTAETKPAFLGLVAGLGVGAGIFYYRSIVNAHLSRVLSPRIVMVHADVQKVMSLANARETNQLADYLTGLLNRNHSSIFSAGLRAGIGTENPTSTHWFARRHRR
jgi:hypothetical protein